MEKPHGVEYSGLRTLTFWSVLGCVAAFLSSTYSPAVLPVVVVAIVANSLLKAGLTQALGSKAFRLPAGVVLGLTAAAGVAALGWASETPSRSSGLR